MTRSFSVSSLREEDPVQHLAAPLEHQVDLLQTGEAQSKMILMEKEQPRKCFFQEGHWLKGCMKTHKDWKELLFTTLLQCVIISGLSWWGSRIRLTEHHLADSSFSKHEGELWCPTVSPVPSCFPSLITAAHTHFIFLRFINLGQTSSRHLKQTPPIPLSLLLLNGVSLVHWLYSSCHYTTHTCFSVFL